MILNSLPVFFYLLQHGTGGLQSPEELSEPISRTKFV